MSDPKPITNEELAVMKTACDLPYHRLYMQQLRCITEIERLQTELQATIRVLLNEIEQLHQLHTDALVKLHKRVKSKLSITPRST